MTDVPKPLSEVAEQVRDEVERSETVRTLLSWFGAQRRGVWVVQRVQDALESVQLATKPDFTAMHLDATLAFVPLPSSPTEAPDDEVEAPSVDPVPRVSLLSSANKAPVTVPRDATISAATTLMLVHDYSQLPVVNGRNVVGLFSWKSYGEATSVGTNCEFVRECMDRSPLILPPETPLLQAVPQVAAREVALIYSQGTLQGIITTSDLSVEFHGSTRPYILLGSIENVIRSIVSRFDIEVLREARDPGDTSRVIEGAHNLTFGEYVRILQKPENWERVSSTLDRAGFIEQLEVVAGIRNEVMHFHPDPLEDHKLTRLESTLRALQMLWTASKQAGRS